MPKSLADLRAKPPSSRPERSLTVCLAPHLVAEVQQLTTELQRIATEPTSPKRAGEGPDPRAVEIQERLAVLLDEMAEDEGELRVRANLSDGDWRRWVNNHPARDKDHPGHDRDERVTGGICNADDLLETLSVFAYAWNGEPLAAEDFEKVIAPGLAPPDAAAAAALVVSMYESRLDFPQLRSGLSGSLERLSGWNSPAPSVSATSGSTGGSPAPSSADTTATGAPAA